MHLLLTFGSFSDFFLNRGLCSSIMVYLTTSRTTESIVRLKMLISCLEMYRTLRWVKNITFSSLPICNTSKGFRLHCFLSPWRIPVMTVLLTSMTATINRLYHVDPLQTACSMVCKAFSNDCNKYENKCIFDAKGVWYFSFVVLKTPSSCIRLSMGQISRCPWMEKGLLGGQTTTSNTETPLSHLWRTPLMVVSYSVYCNIYLLCWSYDAGWLYFDEGRDGCSQDITEKEKGLNSGLSC